jgi:hypothetical protein
MDWTPIWIAVGWLGAGLVFSILVMTIIYHKDSCLTVRDLYICFLIFFLGPMSLIFMSEILGDKGLDHVIIRKRNKGEEKK